MTFECFNETSPNCSCHFSNYNVNFYSNFASLFSVMKDNFLVFLLLKPCMLWTKRAHRKEIFRLLSGPNSSCHIWNHKSVFLFTMHHSSVSWVIRDNSSVFFQLKYMIWRKGTHQSAKFQTSDCSREISTNLYFDRLLLLNVYKVMSWH